MFDPIDIRHFHAAPADQARAGGRQGETRGAARVLFEEDFAAPRQARHAAEPVPPREPAAPSFSEAELEDARRAAFREGKDAGRTAARAEAEAAGQAALVAIASELTASARAAEVATAEAAEAAVRLVIGTLSALHPSLSQVLAGADIATMVARIAPLLAGEPKLTIRLCPPLIETVGPGLRAVAADAGYQGEITLRPDPAVAPDGAAISWSAGAALRDPPALRQGLIEALASLGLGPLTPPSASETNAHVERTA